jgi:hypothetical protein
MYNRLFGKILDSSIWLESDSTVRLWFTFLASMDEDGFCTFACEENLGRRARIKPSVLKRALAILEAPDPNSSDPDNEGRRIERVPGGWIVLNAVKYRHLGSREAARESTRQRVATHRSQAEHLGTTRLSSEHLGFPRNTLEQLDVTSEHLGTHTALSPLSSVSENHTVTVCNTSEAEAEADAEERGKEKPPDTAPGTPEGLHQLQYAAGFLEDLGLPSSTSLLNVAASAIAAHAKKQAITKAQAFDEILHLAREDLEAGAPINRFWFEDGKYGPNRGKEKSSGRQSGEDLHQQNLHELAELGQLRRARRMATSEDGGAQGNVPAVCT